MQSRNGLLMVAAALCLVVGVTIVQGRWTERWAQRQDDLLEKAARRLERLFPQNFGDWALDRQLETSQAELQRAGAVGSVSRIYRNAKTKTAVSAFVVCASPHDASGHTPDRCYPGAGFEIAEPEHRETISLRDGRVAEAFTGTFAKQGQTIRVFWTYGVPEGKSTEQEAAAGETPAGATPPAGQGEALTWVAPQIARIALNDYPSVYKLYAIIDQTKLPSSRASAECSDFIAQLLPASQTALVTDSPGAAAVPQPTEPQAEGDRDATSG